jgi:hypothetical protein
MEAENEHVALKLTHNKTLRTDQNSKRASMDKIWLDMKKKFEIEQTLTVEDKEAVVEAANNAVDQPSLEKAKEESNQEKVQETLAEKTDPVQETGPSEPMEIAETVIKVEDAACESKEANNVQLPVNQDPTETVKQEEAPLADPLI